ncbi:hypothetical protein IWW51_000821 [Coemansia sp. RSA 2702]|nr:hypothetical protein IWW51_000821 [Coemansia sp. RSA 2702]
MGLGSPKPLATDMTLVAAPSLRARLRDLQPLNDPFIIDNIFKSPKKRRRGLLSWGAMPHTDADRPAATLWDFPRHVRARNRRRSILGSKYSLSSMKRRRPRSSVGEHTRSASDPTSAISPLSKPAALDQSYDSLSSESRPARPFIATTPLLPFEPEPTHPRLHAFPRLRDDASIRGSIFRLSESFTILPPAHGLASTLRGVPGHPAISMTMLQMASDAVTQPPAALLRSDNTAQAQPCTLLPQPESSHMKAQQPQPVVFDPAERAVPRCPAISAFDMSPPTRFNMVKNSLEIRQPAPTSAQTRNRECTPKPREASVDSWQLPTPIRILRRIAICSGLRKR